MPNNKSKSSAKASMSRKSAASVAPPARKSVAPPAARKSGASVPPPGARRSAPPAGRKSQAPAARKSMPPSGRKSVIPPAPKVPRKFGLRGAAPWALRHAERQAEEVAKRNREPPKPGSARATLRTPQGAEGIKASIGELHGLVQKLRGLQKNFEAGFFELGVILGDIEARKLYVAKGYSNIDSFAERELGLGKGLAPKLVRIPMLFQPEAARELRLEALLRALDAIDQSPQTGKSGAAKLPLKPLKPPR